MAHTTGAYPSFHSMTWLEVLLLLLDGMSIAAYSPALQFAGTHLYSWVERGTMKVKYLAQEHDTNELAMTQARTFRSEIQYTNH